MSEDWLKLWYKEKYTMATAEKSEPRVWNEINTTIKSWWKSWYRANTTDAQVDRNARLSNWSVIEARLKMQALIRRQTKLRYVRFTSLSLLVILSPFILGDLEMGVSSLQSSTDSRLHSRLEALDQPLESVDASKTNQTEKNLPEAVFAQSQTVNPTLLAVVDTTFSNNLEFPNDPSMLPSSSGLDADYLTVNLEVVPVQSFSNTNANTILPDESLTQLDRKEVRRPTWMFGVNTNLQYSNLLNPTHQMGLDSKSHIKLIMGSCISYDLSAMRKLGPKSWLEAAVRLNDKKSQVYNDFIGSDYGKKSLLLNYQTVSLAYRHSFISNVSPRVGFEFSSGIYGSYLSSVKEYWGEEERFVLTEGFKPYDFGVQLGTEGVFSLNQSFDLTAGLDCSYGIMNVFHGIDKLPAYFYRTFTSSFGANVGIRYKLVR
jgi:hypothetical protein